MAKFPELLACLIAEQVRPELGNKMTILGYMGASPTVKLYAPSFPAMLTFSLIFQFGIAQESASWTVQIEVDGPMGNVLPLQNAPEEVHTGAGMNASLVLAFQGMPVLAPGDYKVKLYSNGTIVCEGSFQMNLQSTVQS